LDPEKEVANRQKHGVGFVEAEEALRDPLAWIRPDTSHAFGDPRFRTIGLTRLGRGHRSVG
jgi:uncharacterized DUF497 family protein